MKLGLYSNKGTIKFRTAFAEVSLDQGSVGVFNIRPLCPTRWSVRCSAIKAALSNYSSIIATLEEFVALDTVTTEQKAKANGLHHQLVQGSTYMSLCMAENVFSLMDRLSKSLQGHEITLDGTLAAVHATMDSLKVMRDEFACP